MAEKHIIDLDLLADTFNIDRTNQCQHLQNWLAATYTLNNFEETLLSQIYEKTKDKVSYFNEEELKVQVVAFLFFLADLDVEHKIKVFYERPLNAVIDDHLLSVIVDCMVAQPMRFNKPKKPYFFLQEYKKGKGDDKDPEAQMLAAMLIAQHQNKNGLPVYGSFTIGSHWNFTTLIDKTYCVSPNFDISKHNDFKQVVFILRKLKDFIFDM
jgi:hypothetical protein